ncbi:MAG: DNA mismatch repair protein MutS [Deltaproteobacteria bacterium]|nr:DNA mismatch repair protein MutS [Deltaproteobacteria bacterium]MBW2383435.1 DNA mismatch repair protein MutS [Deltaproteobacteria bacterium]MBW2695097.1 DNA mismatch repair protein MutS [Deltaproteobacteria bacterium]
MVSALDTPMMRQYLGIKAGHPDAIVFYRMGDFYEMFLDDAVLAAPLLDIALTTRDKGKSDAVPMCGVPVHSADQYVKQLAALGHRVAICEQVEDPKQLTTRRLVRREVVEVITPGLVGDPEGIDGREEVSLVALAAADASGSAGLAALDASTGDFRATATDDDTSGEPLPEALLEELQRISPREVLVLPELRDALADRLRILLPDAVVTTVPGEHFDPTKLPVVPDGLQACESAGARRASAALLRYLGENQPFALSHAPRLRHYELSDTVILDAATLRHLELFENSEDRGRKGTLVSILDRSRTALGARRLARWIAYPLKNPTAIQHRQEAVAWLAEEDRARAHLREALGEVRDLERILAKAARPGAVPRDLGLLRDSLHALPDVGAALDVEEGALFESETREPVDRPDGIRAPEPLPDLAELLAEALVDEPPVIARGSRGANESGYVRKGFRSDLDAIHESAAKGREWIAGLEVTERERTGIGGLRVRYHPVHGYSLEVSKTQLEKVPADYERKQTLANVERFTTDALREVESTVMGAAERAAALEREIFETLRETVVGAAGRIRAAAEAVADLDAEASLAEVARREGWVRPQVDEGDRILVRGGRHPVVESVLRRGSADGFVPNDTDLSCSDTRILILTGPNMSGKSTYLRQVALIVLLAQIGSYVPAESARIGVVDRIFTRVGASDRLSRGESTFMVEMRETAEILRRASARSLIILDEIGRGTSTFDGLSIAWAVAEYLHDTPGLEARTLFATHYHELIELARARRHVANAHFEVREWQDEVVFLRRLVEGGASRSYGIQVAQLAGLPNAVVERAKEILHELESGDREPFPSISGAKGQGETDERQLALSLPPTDVVSRTEQLEVLAEIEALDVEATTPLDALQALSRWRDRLRRRP